MLSVRVCATHMGEFRAQNFLNKGPSFGRFSIRVGYPEVGKKKPKMGGFPQKFIIKVSMTANFGD